MDLATFRSNLRTKLKDNKITLNLLADKSDLSEDTLRSIIYGQSQDIKLSTLIKIADVFNCSIDELVNRSIYTYEEQKLFGKIHNLSNNSVSAVKNLVNLEEKHMLKNENHGRNYLTLFMPKGTLYDGMFYDGNLYKSIDITNYPTALRHEISFGLLISTQYYEPIFYPNDILLLSVKVPPKQHDIVIYINEQGKIFIRKYTELGLEPIGRFGDLIPLKECHNYKPLGVVIKTINEFDIEQYR